MYYPCSENRGADQLRSYCEADLRSYCEADLRLCFRLCRLLVFPCGGSVFLRMPGRTIILVLRTFNVTKICKHSAPLSGDCSISQYDNN